MSTIENDDANAGAAAGSATDLGYSTTSDISIVALGASAGGLDALDRFFSALGPCSQTAFVVIQHLSPDHKSMMGDILSRHTAMPVHVAEQEMHVLPGHVYVIPPGMTMTLVGSERIRLTPKPAKGLSLPIDDFFNSLASELGERAIGIVLSGTGSDGSRGILALSDAGAWVFAQDPESSKFDGMPRSAIATGVVDKVLPPEGLAGAVMTAVAPAATRKAVMPHLTSSPDEAEALSTLLSQLTGALQIDFQEYKNNTVIRRVERRMKACGCDTFTAYLSYISGHPSEVQNLRRELLIPVSAFLRDPDAFELLRTEVLTPLVQQRTAPKSAPIRIWVTATAKGEEAYTVAMMLDDVMRQAGLFVEYKIFATDVETSYIEHAAEGRYTTDALTGLPQEWIERNFNFSSDGKSVQIAPHIRQKIVFARHNLLADPPLTNMDLVTCRNMLIYLRPAAQVKVLKRLEYALKLGGCLFLGGSESLMEEGSFFKVIDSRNKLFQLVQRSTGIPAPSSDSSAGVRSRVRTRHRTSTNNEEGVVEAATAEILDRYSPAALLVTSSRELVHVYGRGRDYLQFRDGRVSLDVIELLPTAIGAVAAALIASVARDGRIQRSSPVDVTLGEVVERISLTVIPVPQPSPGKHVLLCFEPIQSDVVTLSAATKMADVDEATLSRITELEHELALTRASLQDTIGELGAANEELQATNEEMVAANEELHSTNEELQSVNEELHTVNAEFQSKIQMLDGTNADLESFIRAIRIPTLIVDEHLCLQRFTPQTTLLFKLREVDVGRPIDELNHRLNYPELYEDLRDAIKLGKPSTRKVLSESRRHYIVDVLPYTVQPERQRRAVVTFVDVTELQEAERLQLVLDALPANLAVLSKTGEILMVNRAWRDFAMRNGDAGLTATGVGTNYLKVCEASAAVETFSRRAFDGITQVLSRVAPSFTMCYPCHSPDEKRWFLMHVTPLEFAEGGCVISHLNVTGILDPVLQNGL